MSIEIVIPTHKRVERQITLGNLPPDCPVTLVVSDPHEAKELTSLHKNRPIKVKVANGATIAEKRHWIMSNLKSKFIFMLDDDLTFFTRCPHRHREWSDGWKAAPGKQFLVKSSYAEVRFALDKLTKLTTQYNLVGMGSRLGNNRVQDVTTVNTRQMHFFGLSRATYLKSGVRFDDVKCREDFHVTLGMLKSGYANVLYHHVCCSPGSYNAAGGASTERTMDISNQEAHRLAELHPGLVRVVAKEYKNEPREEVIVQWKKAAKIGGVV